MIFLICGPGASLGNYVPICSPTYSVLEINRHLNAHEPYYEVIHILHLSNIEFIDSKYRFPYLILEISDFSFTEIS